VVDRLVAQQRMVLTVVHLARQLHMLAVLVPVVNPQTVVVVVQAP
jgi:hypothetical protein